MANLTYDQPKVTDLIKWTQIWSVGCDKKEQSVRTGKYQKQCPSNKHYLLKVIIQGNFMIAYDYIFGSEQIDHIVVKQFLKQCHDPHLNIVFSI